MSENHRKDQNISARKLAAIMFTDIVGYTSLMGGDEHNAFNILTTNLEIHNRLIKKYNGKIVKELGDGLFSIFENGTEAVQCAIGIQQEASRNGIPLRIGIHEGEVVFKNNDVFGDGVNIASRIQDEAAKGGICISDSVYRIIKNKTDIDAESIGIKHLKNVDEDIKLYQIKAEGITHLMAYSNLKKSKIVLWPVVIIIAILLFIGGWFLNEKSKNESLIQIEKFNVVLPSKAPVVCSLGVLPVTISPDGKVIVYQAFYDNKMFLYKRYLNQYDAFPISGTEGGEGPFFSPDGKWIGFFANGIIKKVLLSGGNPVDICPLPGCSRGVWLPDNSIVASVTGKGLVQVSSTGGDYSPITSVKTEIGEWVHNHPFYLPDERTILYSVTNGAGEPLYIKSINLDNSEEKIIINDAIFPIFDRSGNLIYAKDGHLMSAPFNLKKLKIEEPSVIMIENIVFQNPSISLSDNGILVYVPDQAHMDELVWVSMKGETQSIIKDNVQLFGPRISPDGSQVALWKAEHVHIYDLARQALDKFTNSGGNFWPVWTPDGKQIAFPALRGGNFVDIYWKAFDKSTPAESLLEVKSEEEIQDYIFQPQMWSNDQQFLLYVQTNGLADDWDIMLLDMENNHLASEFIATEFNERHPRLSPDNQWVAYQSTETGKYEIYVTRFPEKGARWQISIDGGTDPLWAPDGKRIYYRYGDQFFAVYISNEFGFKAGKPEVLFSGKFRKHIFGWYYDMHPDGDKFIMVKAGEVDTTQNKINVIKNFRNEIEVKLALVQ